MASRRGVIVLRAEHTMSASIHTELPSRPDSPRRRRAVATSVASSVAASVALCVAASTAPAATFQGFFGETSRVTSGGVEYSVVDVYAQFAQTSVVVVNVYDATISNANASTFRHSDSNTIQSLAGTWLPSAIIWPSARATSSPPAACTSAVPTSTSSCRWPG